MDLANIAHNVGPLLKRNSSTILTGIGVAGSVGSLLLGVKATPKALGKLDQAYVQKNLDSNNAESVPLTKREVVKLVWIDYLPAVGLQVVTIACVIGAQSINMRKQAALISVATVSETAFREYQERMSVEAPAKDRKVRDDIARETVEANPVSSREVLLVNGGEQLFYETQTDRYFMSSMQKVQKAVNELNYQIINDDYASLNDFFSLLGLKTVTQGDNLGWNTDFKLEVEYSAQRTDDDRTAMVLEYYKLPIANFYRGFR